MQLQICVMAIYWMKIGKDTTVSNVQEITEALHLYRTACSAIQ